MLIVCPACASAYRIDAAKVGPEGRSVRCASCRETWFLSPAEVLAAREAELAEPAEADGAASDPMAEAAWRDAAAAVRATCADAPSPEPAARRPGRATRRTAGAGGLAGLRARLAVSPGLALALVLAAALPLACLARAAIVRAVPQTAALYAGIGLPVNLRGIEIRDVVAFSRPGEDGRPGELVVEGDLVGVGRTDAPVAALAVEVRDAGGRPLRTYPVPPPRAMLAPGESARFRTSVPAPPAGGRQVELHFADAGPSKPAMRVATEMH